MHKNSAKRANNSGNQELGLETLVEDERQFSGLKNEASTGVSKTAVPSSGHLRLSAMKINPNILP